MAAPREVLIHKWKHLTNVLESSDLTAERTTDTWDAEPFSGAFLLVKYTYNAAVDFQVTFETSYDGGTTWYFVPEIQAGGAGSKFKFLDSDAASVNIYVPVNAGGCSLMRAKISNPGGGATGSDLVEAKLILTRGV